MLPKYKVLAFKIAAVYAFVGGMWILFSDKLLSALIKDPDKIIRIGMFKGWFYVATTAIMIYLLIKRDMKELEKSKKALKEREEKITYQAYHDALTGLPNRLLFIESLSNELQRAQEQEKMLAVLFIDLDLFKNINDSLGHAIGDNFLIAIASRLKRCLKNKCIISRIGGDEFTILLPLITDESETEKAAFETLKAFKDPFIIDGYELYITISIGISIFPKDGQDIKSLFKNADVAMYSAKQAGRNMYQRYNSEMSKNASRRLALESNLRKALERKEFTLHYQPQVDMQTLKIVGMEALLRWNNIDLGEVSPAEFIPIAEETGLIVPIGEWVLRTACIQNQLWIKKGFKPLRMSVNVSIRQLYTNKFVQNVARALEETGMKANYLSIEITESSLMQNAEECINLLNTLKDLGISISMDDFGTGYSSLSYLRRLPIDIIKIDRSFVKEITKEKDIASIIVAVINMSQSLGLHVIAEGVETEEQNSFLFSRNCNEVQGYLYSKALPAEEFEKSMLNVI